MIGIQCLLIDHMVFSPKYRGKIFRRFYESEFHEFKEWCKQSLWAPYQGSIGHSWEVVEKYIQNQEKPNAKKSYTDIEL